MQHETAVGRLVSSREPIKQVFWPTSSRSPKGADAASLRGISSASSAVGENKGGTPQPPRSSFSSATATATAEEESPNTTILSLPPIPIGPKLFIILEYYTVLVLRLAQAILLAAKLGSPLASARWAVIFLLVRLWAVWQLSTIIVALETLHRGVYLADTQRSELKTIVTLQIVAFVTVSVLLYTTLQTNRAPPPTPPPSSDRPPLQPQTSAQSSSSSPSSSSALAAASPVWSTAPKASGRRNSQLHAVIVAAAQGTRNQEPKNQDGRMTKVKVKQCAESETEQICRSGLETRRPIAGGGQIAQHETVRSRRPPENWFNSVRDAGLRPQSPLRNVELLAELCPGPLTRALRTTQRTSIIAAPDDIPVLAFGGAYLVAVEPAKFFDEPTLPFQTSKQYDVGLSTIATCKNCRPTSITHWAEFEPAALEWMQA
ncbi:hypothetical protein BDK51DRAFT_42158 [Blyttiomyces helicus]|uniref:Uncharacterized protein n=1 Tax=Blyttiomyces helicus TaxID=388810 RepID=A0A4P9WMK9_9FUNG|nr:hypothetical protein BDK51DRAFT_42158 [Blyttiomyces helicus]|eukprot:RKO94309.1 hypothetical protein BDK51DRAFT_42158 [Blyttiomyces helicus]